MRPPLEAAGPPGWMETGVHGVPRPRQWEAVVTVHAPSAKGDAAQFVVLLDGRVHVEHGEVVEDLAAAAGGALAPAFRAEAVRRDGDHWALGLRKIQVVELPEVEGDELVLAVNADERTLIIDGSPAQWRPALQPLLRDGDYVIEAARLDGASWEFRVAQL
jgi:hypothetical protein